MRRTVVRLVFLLIVLGLVAGLHRWLWLRLVHEPQLPEPVATGLGVLLALAAPALPAFMALGRRASGGRRRGGALLGYTWLGVLWLSVVSLGLLELSRLGLTLALGPDPTPPARARLLAGAATAALLALTLASLWRARVPRVRRVEVQLAKLPPALDGFRLAQLSDVHVGPTIGAEELAGYVSATNALAPDLVAITGDLVDGPVSRLGAEVAPLRELQAKHGVYFVTGNHEYYSGAPEWCEHLGRLGIRVLRNERVRIGDETSSFDLAGIDDLHAFGPGHGPDVERALADRDPERALVLLAHQPRAARLAAGRGVGLQLSGHTHGGQIWPWHYFVYLQQPLLAGLGKLGDVPVYTSRGTGYWGPPMRLFAPAEITLLTLRASGAGAAGSPKKLADQPQGPG